MPGLSPSGRATWVSTVGIVSLFLIQFSIVKATNIGGWDEWLDIDLAARGILSMPYQNRPLSLLFFLPGAAVWTFGLEGFKWVHSFYLASTGVLTYLVCRRLRGGHEALAFLAGALAATWAPEDSLRLDVVLGRGYAGATAGILFGILLFVESYLVRSVLGLGLSCVIVAVVVRSAEAVAPLALAAPVLLFWMEVPDTKRRLRWIAFYGVVALATTAWAALPLLVGTSGSYQTSALGFDPRPLEVASRLLMLAIYQIGPLFSVEVTELFRPVSGASAAVFLITWFLLAKLEAGAREPPPAAVLGCAVAGAGAATLGWTAFALSGAIRSGDRTQFLSAPGVGLLLASVCWLLASPLPRRARVVALGACGAFVVALAAGKTATLQGRWDRESYWGVQRNSLLQLTSLVPMTEPNTLIILVDDAQTWQANFAFRHAIEHFYSGAAKGLVPGAHSEYLYPSRFTERGLRYEPWAAIQGPWHAPITKHRYDEIVVVRLGRDGRLSLEETWPEGPLPALPPDARYDPRARIDSTGPLPASRSLLSHP